MSVILVVRNGERFIAQALDSVASSDIKPIEILVIDGGSTDRTAEIARGFPRACVIAQEGTGIPRAYNQGVARAKGEFIAFISHDDVWLAGKLDRQISAMLAEPALGFTVTMVRHFLEPDATVPSGFRAELLDRPVPGMIMEALLARRWVFDRVGPFDEGFAVGEDTDWFARARDLGIPMRVVPEVLVEKRVHTTNSSLAEPSINALLLRAMRRSVVRKRSGREATSVATVPQVSVIVPCYNAALYLAEAIASIQAQDTGALEIIVIDDGSTDASAAVARAFGACVRCERQENAGAAAARNRGIALARGSYLAFLDADDVWPRDSLKVRLDELLAHPGTDCVFGAVEEFASPDADASVAAPRPAAMARFAGTMLLTRAAFERVGPFDSSLRIGEALDWFARADDAGLVMRGIESVVLRRRLHGDNLVTRERSRQGDYLRALRRSIERRRGATAVKGQT